MRLLPLLLIAVLAAAEGPVPELKEIPYDTLIFSDGNSMPGTLLEQRTDGTLIFQQQGKEKPITIPKGSWTRIQPRRPAARVASEVAAHAMSTGNNRLLADAVKFAFDKNAIEVGQRLTKDALARNPANREVLAVAVPFWKEHKEDATIESAARAALKADPHWDDGHALILDALIAQNRTEAIDAYARDWLSTNPTALRANLICGQSFENAGDIRSARECWRKAWELSKSLDGALGFARTSLMLGNFADAQRAGEALIQANHKISETRAYAGATAAALGDLAKAKALLADYKQEELPGPAAQAGTYALGLIAFREGRINEAAKLWATLQTPSAQFALAIAQRREFAATDRLPADLRPAARVLNASVRLEGNRAADAKQLLDPHLDGRHAFLDRAANMLAAKGSQESVRALAAVRSPESQRWQIYGHIIGNRYDDAEALAKTLPGDGYAASCRVYLAAARGDGEGARTLFQNLPNTPTLPKAYQQRLGELYAAADDQTISEPFDWPEGEVVQSGWEISAPGTGIRVSAAGGKLIFAGTQTNTEETRAATSVPGSRFRAARLVMDLSAAGKATAGLELLDSARKNGLAIAVRPEIRNLQWRPLNQGVWGSWKELPFQVDGNAATIAIDATAGKVFISDPADPLRRQALSDQMSKVQGDWWLTLFGRADPGTAWKVAFDDLRWRLKPEKK